MTGATDGATGKIPADLDLAKDATIYSWLKHVFRLRQTILGV